MECKEAEDLYAEYILGALDSGDRYRVEAHLAFCRECNLNIQGDGETVAAIALGAPPLEAPQRIKRRLLAAVRAEMEAGQTVPTRVGLGTLVAGFFRGTYAHAGKANGGAVVVAWLLRASGSTPASTRSRGTRSRSARRWARWPNRRPRSP